VFWRPVCVIAILAGGVAGGPPDRLGRRIFLFGDGGRFRFSRSSRWSHDQPPFWLTHGARGPAFAADVAGPILFPVLAVLFGLLRSPCWSWWVISSGHNVDTPNAARERDAGAVRDKRKLAGPASYGIDVFPYQGFRPSRSAPVMGGWAGRSVRARRLCLWSARISSR